MPTPQGGIEGARALRNRHTTCDWCGEVPALLYLPLKFNGAFCKACVVDVLNPPPPKPIRLAPDGLPSDDVAATLRKLDAYLRKRPEEPHFCGTGRGRPHGRKAAQSRRLTIKKAPHERIPAVINNWKFFSRTDRVRIVRERKLPFVGQRARVWTLLHEMDGSTIGQILARSDSTGLAEPQVIGILRRLITAYGVLAVER